MKMQTLRISDEKDEYRILSFDLKDILSECQEYYGHRWVAWKVECDFSLWRDTFREAPNQQVEMSFNEVIDYAAHLRGQTEMGFFIAIKPNLKKVPVLNDDLDLREISDLIINAFDFSFFEVTTSDEAVIRRLKNKFKEIEFVSEPWWRERER